MNTSIKVAAGHYFDLLHPHSRLVDIRSIAASLSKICRFGGHCPDFYSVAEHCVRAFELAKGDGVRHGGLKAILLHDATEAYVGDMVKPLKEIMPQFQDAEARVESAVAAALNVDFRLWHGDIKTYDLIMLKAERDAMWPGMTDEWECLMGVPSRDVQFGWWCPQVAESAFLDAARSIGIKT